MLEDISKCSVKWEFLIFVMIMFLLLGLENQGHITFVVTPSTFVSAHTVLMIVEVVFNDAGEMIVEHFECFITVLVQTVRNFLFQMGTVYLVKC